MSVPLHSPVGYDSLESFSLPPGFNAMSKKVQQLWKTCQQLEQRAYPVKICTSCWEKHRASQLFVCQASILGAFPKGALAVSLAIPHAMLLEIRYGFFLFHVAHCG